MRWTVALGLLSLLIAGCGLPFYYAYPTVLQTPRIDLATNRGPDWSVLSARGDGPLTNEVHAYLVEVTDQRTPSLPPAQDQHQCQYVFRAIAPSFAYDSWIQTGNPVTHQGVSYIPGQTRVSLETGQFWLGLAMWPISNETHTRHHVLLRLYAPGYQLVQILPGAASEGWEWKKRDDVASREQAIDDLLSTTASNASGSEAADEPTAIFRNLAPGSASTQHKAALLFAAAEYEQLSQHEKGESVSRWLAKAAWLRALSEK
jgi:hypothetical protein